MARQERACWRCVAAWVSEDAPRATLRVIAGGSAGSEAARIPTRAAAATG